jgi:hypothetical protein
MEAVINKEEMQYLLEAINYSEDEIRWVMEAVSTKEDRQDLL